MEKKEKRTLRKIPYDVEAEQAVLGSALINENAVLGIMEKLKEDDFYVNSHKVIFSCMLDLYTSNKPIDMVTLLDILQVKGIEESVGGLDYVLSLTNAPPNEANYKHYVDIVKRDSILRKLIAASEEIIEKTYTNEEEDMLSFAEKKIFDIAEKEDTSSLVDMVSVIPSVMQKFEEIDKNGGAIRGVPTGFSELDAITHGLQKSDLILLAARPSFGKTSLAMNIVNNAAIKYNKKVAVFSLEMPKEQITQRTLCSISGVSMEKALGGELSKTEWKALHEGGKKLNNAKLYIDDSSLNTPTNILSKCRRLKREEGGLDLVMIDYLQLMTSGKRGYDGSNRQNEIGDLTRSLKIAARELDVPILLLSQLSRDVDKRKDDHRPVLSDLRESGSIEQDADIVMFIYNPEHYGDVETAPNMRELMIAKHRNGSLANIKLKWIPELTTFVDIGQNSERKSLEESVPQYYEEEEKVALSDEDAPPEDIEY